MSGIAQFVILAASLVTGLQGSVVGDDVAMPNHWGSCVCQVSCASSTAGDVNLFYRGVKTSGVYNVYVGSSYKPLDVYCDMDTAGGGWLVFQRRQDGSVDFFRNWETYKMGFGDVEAEFWLGNSDLHRVTHTKYNVLRIELEDFENETRTANYATFSVKSAAEGFELVLGGFSGNAGGDSMAYHTGRVFSTQDQGPSSGCANSYKGGWWYGECHQANLNSLYLKGAHESYGDGVEWKHWHQYHYSLKRTEMKIRPMDF